MHQVRLVWGLAGPTGIEPAAYGLRVRRSSLTELRARKASLLKKVSLSNIELAVLLLQLDAVKTTNKKGVDKMINEHKYFSKNPSKNCLFLMNLRYPNILGFASVETIHMGGPFVEIALNRMVIIVSSGSLNC